MEVLLTMAIMVIIAGVAWTALQRPWARQRVRSAADEIRTGLEQARINAMKSNHTYSFRYMLHGGRYHLGPQSDASSADTPPATSSATSQHSAADEEGLGDEPLPPPIDKTLPRGIRFLPADGIGELATMDDSDSRSTETGDSWSDPIYFYADGSTSDARLLLASSRHAAMRLQLKGVTGSVTVDDATSVTQ